MGVKFRFARKRKTKPPQSEEEEQGEEPGGSEEEETIEQLEQDASTLVQPTETQEPQPLPPPPKQVPSRLRLAQAQVPTEPRPIVQIPSPPTRQPPHQPQVVARRPMQTARHDLPIKARQPIYSRAICIITKDVNGIRVVLKSLVVPTIRDFFRVGEHMFHVDISRAFMVSAKGPYLMYDIDITEPLNKDAVNEKVEHKPILLGDEVHYSPHVNLLLQGEVIKQALKSIGETSGFNMMTWLLFAVGAIMGLFIGLYLAPLIHIGAVTTTTTTTTTAATMPVIWRLLRL